MRSYRLQSVDSKKGKSADGNGIRAEDIKACDDETREMVRQIFNDIMMRNEFRDERDGETDLPRGSKTKKYTRGMAMIHKKGDVEDFGNYRPICSLLALYKLFSTRPYSRLYPRLDQKQAEDQAGFRSSYPTTDHLATCRMIHEWESKCGQQQSTSQRHSTPITHKINLERPQILRYRSRLHQPPEEDSQRTNDQERNQTG